MEISALMEVCSNGKQFGLKKEIILFPCWEGGNIKGSI